MRFFENEIQPEMVGCRLSNEELQRFLKEQGISMQIVDNSTRWAAYGQWYAHRKGWDVIRSTSFSYMVSLFFAGMGVSASTEMYIKEETMEYDIIDFLNEIKENPLPPEQERAVPAVLFQHIVDIYANHIDKYEYATERLSLKLTPSQMARFQAVEGDTMKDKFLYLLQQIQ